MLWTTTLTRAPWMSTPLVSHEHAGGGEGPVGAGSVSVGGGAVSDGGTGEDVGGGAVAEEVGLTVAVGLIEGITGKEATGVSAGRVRVAVGGKEVAVASDSVGVADDAEPAGVDVGGTRVGVGVRVRVADSPLVPVGEASAGTSVGVPLPVGSPPIADPTEPGMVALWRPPAWAVRVV